MSSDRHLFQAPTRYPEPPENLYFEAPRQKPMPERPKPIFPWEANQRKATRVFADDLPTTPSEVAPSTTTDDETQTETVSPTTPAISTSSQESMAAFSRSNAWDEMPEIDRYIANLPQNRKAKLQVLFNSAQEKANASKEPTASSVLESSRPNSDRRGSMKITDFPTEIERPSLPVTPAPVRRPSFWGEERDAAGELPAAEGVPEQSQWDPRERLAELQRRQSEVLENGPQSPPRPIPNRKLLGSAEPILEEVGTNDSIRESAAMSEQSAPESIQRSEPTSPLEPTRPSAQEQKSRSEREPEREQTAEPSKTLEPTQPLEFNQISEPTQPAKSLELSPSTEPEDPINPTTKVPLAEGVATFPTVPITTPLDFSGGA